jgi:hypothetical protein
MSGNTPYRVSHAARCARCETPLPTTAPREPQVCDSGCGEWLSLAAVDEHLCPEVLDLAKGGAWWKPAHNTPPCTMCGQAMQAIKAAEGIFYRCAEHGLWFDKKRRDEVAHQLASQIAQHRQLREIVELLKRGDEASLRSFAQRFLSLEIQVAVLRREIARR